jgi:repressor LexA
MTTPPLTRRQRQILDFLESYCRRNGISPTLEEIAQQFGVNKVTIFGHIAELERKGMLVRGGRGISRSLRVAPDAQRARSSIPILGKIAAGRPIQAVEEPDELDLIDLFPTQEDLYALTVKGDSMIEDAICDGDMVIVVRNRPVENGDIVVAILPGEEATLKRFYKEGDSVRLQPANSALEPIFVRDVEVRGVVVGVVRRF